MPKARKRVKTPKPTKPTRKASKSAKRTTAARKVAQPEAPKQAHAAIRHVVPPSPAMQRLGEGLPTAPKLSREPVTVIIARTDIVAGGVRIKSTGPSALRVAKGQVIHVKHAYRLQEHSPEREEYRFLLKSKLAGKEHAPSLVRLGDQWGVPEDVAGYLQHEYTLGNPGMHSLEFEVGSEYCVMGWGNTTVQALDRKDLKGRVDILVG